MIFICTWTIDVEALHIDLENRAFSTFGNDSDFVSLAFLISTDSLNSEVFVDVLLSLDKSIGEKW